MSLQSGTFIRATTSPCPVCKKRLDATIVEVKGQVRMRKTCPDHGEFDLLVTRDAVFFRDVAAIVGPPPSDPERSEKFADFGKTRGICLDLTQRCNLSCVNCFSNANVKLKPDLTPEEIFAKADKISGRKPVIFLQGGEPTLHPDLPEIVRGLVKRDCVPKLISNGLKLTDESYLQELKDAGLDWIFLQFDGFSDDTYAAFRGRPLLEKKLSALKLLGQYDFSVLLAVMIEPDYNLKEVGRILEFAFDTPCVRQISFLPGARIGRNALTDEANRCEPIDIIDAMDRATKGGVTRKDFLAFMKIAKALYKLTGNPDYKPKSCFFPMALYRDGGQIMGLNRVINPGQALSHPGLISSGAKMALGVKRLDTTVQDPNTLWLCIEHFRELATLDISDALHCNKLFLDSRGRFVKSCLYNNLYRR